MTEVPIGWTIAPLERLAAPDRPICYGILMPKEHVDDGIPYVKVKDFPSGSINVASLRRTAPAIAAKYERSTLRSGDVLVSIRGTYGRVAIVPDELAGGNITQDTARVTPSDAVDGRFLAYFLRSKAAQDFFGEVARGVAVKGVNIGDLRQLQCPVPPLGEQRRVVAAIDEHFSRLDEGDESLDSAGRRLGSLLLAMRRSLSDARWPRRRLRDVANTQLGKMLSAKSRTGVGSTPYLRNRNVRWGVVDVREVAYMDFTEEERKKFALEPGDVLICEGGAGVGRTAVWRGELDACCYQKALHRVRVGPELLPEFLCQFMRHFVESREMDRHLSGVAIGHLPQEDLRVLEVPVPPLDEQRRWLERIDAVESVAMAIGETISHARRRAEILRRSVLTEAFAGRLAPQDPGDEPASELLARITPERVDAPKPRRRQRA